MVGVASDVVATAAIDRPPGINAKEIFTDALVDYLVGNVRAGVFNDPRALGNGMLGE